MGRWERRRKGEFTSHVTPREAGRARDSSASPAGSRPADTPVSDLWPRERTRWGLSLNFAGPPRWVRVRQPPPAQSTLGRRQTAFRGLKSQASYVDKSPRTCHPIGPPRDNTASLPRQPPLPLSCLPSRLLHPQTGTILFFFFFFQIFYKNQGWGKWPRQAYPVKESHIIIRLLGPLSAVAIHLRSSLMQRQEITLRWPYRDEGEAL